MSYFAYHSPGHSPVLASYSGRWFSSEEYAKDHASKAGLNILPCPEWCVGSVFVEYCTDTETIQLEDVRECQQFETSQEEGPLWFVSLFSLISVD